MAEVRESFSNAEEWSRWTRELGDVESIRQHILSDIIQRGYTEPLTNVRRHPHDILLKTRSLHESIRSHGLNARQRALLAQFMVEMELRGWFDRQDLRILGTDATSRLALILRGRFPLYLGAEYFANESLRQEFFPVPHLDLQDIQYDDESFDVCLCSHSLQQVPDLSRALTEIQRILKPDGVFIASVPFEPDRIKTRIVSAVPDDDLQVPAAHPERAVYQLPGWDLLDALKLSGFSRSYYSIIASSQLGIVSSNSLGPFVLTAVKKGPSADSPSCPPRLTANFPLPEKLCTLIGLPRSGTTLLTSLFAVHSKVEAVYEPWNAKKLTNAGEARIEVLAEAERLPDLSGKILFVKETAARHEYIGNIRKLLESAPFPVERHMLLLLRRPEQVFLSEVERRIEWWNAKISLDQSAFDSWCSKSRTSLRAMLEFGLSADGTVVLLEHLAEQPEPVLAALTSRMAIDFERSQLEYERHIDRRRIRGDVNLSKEPSKIAAAAVLSREDKADIVQSFVMNSPHAAWFDNFRQLYDEIDRNGGLQPIRALRKDIVAALVD